MCCLIRGDARPFELITFDGKKKERDGEESGQAAKRPNPPNDECHCVVLILQGFESFLASIGWIGLLLARHVCPLWWALMRRATTWSLLTRQATSATRATIATLYYWSSESNQNLKEFPSLLSRWNARLIDVHPSSTDQLLESLILEPSLIEHIRNESSQTAVNFLGTTRRRFQNFWQVVELNWNRRSFSI